MDTIPFLSIEQDTISLQQAIQYWQSSGLFPAMLKEVIQQYFIRKEISQRNSTSVDEVELDQACLEFRLQNQIVDAQSFEHWLKINNFTYQSFREKISFTLSVEKLKSEIAKPDIESRFSDQKSLLDSVSLSRLIVEVKDISDNLENELKSSPNLFESLAKEYSVTDDRINGGFMGAVSKGQMPDTLKELVESHTVGEVIGPLEIDGRYCFFRIEGFLPASLEDANLRQELSNQLFDIWMQDKVSSSKIKLEVV